MKKVLICIVAAAMLFSCSGTDVLDGKAYLVWVKNPENGLKIQKEMNGISYEAQYKPYDFIVLNEEKNYNLPKSLVDSRKEELSGMVYYNLRITTDNQTDVVAKDVLDKSMYIQRLNYLSYDFQSLIQLQTEKETVNCSLYHFVHQQGITPYVDMVLGFSVKEEPGSQTLIIDDQVFGNGTLKFYLDKKNIEEIPQLKTT
ncbi:MAG: hypothetical protein KDD41_04000 [Flavobacteriales bacterium]|nr:hypothetical protein [Flavobacteriales bacterium]